MKILQDGCIAPDILGICKFMMYMGLTLDHFAKIISALTNWNIDGKELLKIGERVINLQKLFNIREGFKYEDDLLPERMKEIPAFGDYKDQERCAISNYEEMLKEYYEERGWDKKTGEPLKEKLKELGLDWFIEEVKDKK